MATCHTDRDYGIIHKHNRRLPQPHDEQEIYLWTFMWTACVSVIVTTILGMIHVLTE